MYIKTNCPICGESLFHDLRIYEKQTITADSSEREIRRIDVLETCTPEELARSALHVLADHVYNGISTNELCKILREKFGVLEQYCCDLIQQLKIEMDMYCPDRQHLYYV
ncbi:hypothetical protein [Methanolobus profundi]|uniref:Uncharacterized protein n=1 Tax=Methanolobus profundi TaxID=487685 RepID=A0A1I4QKR5_9EURY|nr:hypothetical protein [Methanolobus profundi]SFM40275.1 hypothetical protein SAMN04488696_1058 [Methanolobus profundi]